MDAERAVRLDPKPWILRFRGSFHLNRNAYEEARKDAESALALTPRSVGGLLFRARVTVAEGENMENALADCTAALAINPLFYHAASRFASQNVLISKLIAFYYRMLKYISNLNYINKDISLKNELIGINSLLKKVESITLPILEFKALKFKHKFGNSMAKIALAIWQSPAYRLLLVRSYCSADTGPRTSSSRTTCRSEAGREGALAGLQAGRENRRAHVPRHQAAGVAARRAGVAGRRRDRWQGQAREVHAVLRCARPRDLLPLRLAGLLPFAHLRQRSGLRRRLRQAARTGKSTKPGRLELGVLLPATGRWRLFLQVTHGGRLLTAPFTLSVR